MGLYAGSWPSCAVCGRKRPPRAMTEGELCLDCHTEREALIADRWARLDRDLDLVVAFDAYCALRTILGDGGGRRSVA